MFVLNLLYFIIFNETVFENSLNERFSFQEFSNSFVIRKIYFSSALSNLISSLLVSTDNTFLMRKNQHRV